MINHSLKPEGKGGCFWSTDQGGKGCIWRSQWKIPTFGDCKEIFLNEEKREEEEEGIEKGSGKESKKRGRRTGETEAEGSGDPSKWDPERKTSTSSTSLLSALLHSLLWLMRNDLGSNSDYNF